MCCRGFELTAPIARILDKVSKNFVELTLGAWAGRISGSSTDAGRTFNWSSRASSSPSPPPTTTKGQGEGDYATTLSSSMHGRLSYRMVPVTPWRIVQIGWMAYGYPLDELWKLTPNPSCQVLPLYSPIMSLVVPEAHQQFQVRKTTLYKIQTTHLPLPTAHSASAQHQCWRKA